MIVGPLGLPDSVVREDRKLGSLAYSDEKKQEQACNNVMSEKTQLGIRAFRSVILKTSKKADRTLAWRESL